jgi:GT2 family glycosyltransferase
LSLPDLGPADVPLGGSLALQQSYRLDRWLREHSFDLVYLPLERAGAYYSLLARRHGLAHHNTTFCLLADEPTLYGLERRGGFLDHVDHLEIDSLERRCVELADAVWEPDAAVTSWMREQDWPRPRRTVASPLAEPLPPPVVRSVERLPLVSVCLVHHDRPGMLRQALTSLEKQDYPFFEIVLVDDGSTSPQAQVYLAELEPLFLARGWRLVRQANRYLGAARNTAARHACGEYLLFMDDDNCAKPEEISSLVRAAERTGADIVTTFMDFFQGAQPPADGQAPLCRWLYAGVDSLAGVARNCFGDANALVRRSAFEALGGFTEDQGVTHEDWELYVRAVLRGYRLEVVPEALFWYRYTPGSMIRTTPQGRNYARSLRPYLEEVPAAHRDLLRLVQGQALAEALRQSLAGQKPLRYRIADTLHRCCTLLPRLFHRLRG